MFVEIVTAPGAPAEAMMRASASSFRAFSTSHRTPDETSRAASRSDSSTLTVPTRIGRPVAWAVRISSTTAASFASREAKTRSG